MLGRRSRDRTAAGAHRGARCSAPSCHVRRARGLLVQSASVRLRPAVAGPVGAGRRAAPPHARILEEVVGRALRPDQGFPAPQITCSIQASSTATGCERPQPRKHVHKTVAEPPLRRWLFVSLVASRVVLLPASFRGSLEVSPRAARSGTRDGIPVPILRADISEGADGRDEVDKAWRAAGGRGPPAAIGATSSP